VHNLSMIRHPGRVTHGGIGFEGDVIEWRGPAPFVYVEVPEDASEAIRADAAGLTYWGQVPVDAVIDGVGFFTALFPKGDAYLVPLTRAVRDRTGARLGDRVAVEVRVTPREHSVYRVPRG
jgi:hypothetical protein